MNPYPAPPGAVPDSDLLVAEALERCASEPIHLAGAVQPHGALLAYDADGRVRMASENLGAFIGIDTAAAIDQPVAALLGDEATAGLERLLQREARQPSLPVTLADRAGAPLQAVVHVSDGLKVVELRRASATPPSFEDVYLPVREALWHFDREDDVVYYCKYIVAEVQRLTGFDRVMAYCFDSQWDGEVIAEAGNGVLPRLLGYHFPAADIPPQARLLYQKNLIRVMEDTEAAAVALLPALNPLNGRPLDMSHSVLRAMSPVHLAYMRNMGVRASITLSLKQGGRLWGLIGCHSATPRQVSFQQRDLLEFIGKTISLKLASLEFDANGRYLSRTRQVLQELGQAVRDSGDVARGLLQVKDDCLGLADAGGCVVNFDGHSFEVGQVPPRAAQQELTEWLRRHMPDRGVLHTESLSRLHPPAAAYAEIGSGLLAIALDADFSSSIYWFRPQVIREIHWAGNPAKQLVQDDGGPRLEPRRSFARWIETALGRSRAWSPVQIDAVKMLSLAVLQLLMPQVLRAREAAELANRAKSDFLATISHEIRTPMNAVIGLTYLCMETELDAQQHDYLKKAHGAARNLLQLLNDILDFSKIEAGKLGLEKVGFDIDDVLERLTTLLAMKAHEKGLEFILHTGLDVPPLLVGDPVRLEQVLVNLAGNAIKFTHQGEIEVRTDVLSRDAARVELEFSVRDTGIGMTPEQTERLFRPFEQADSSITRHYGGTGLGLSICQRLVQLMHGRLDLESRPGCGSTFRIRLPFELPADTSAERPRPTMLRGLRVLVLETAPASRRVLCGYLQSFRFQVAECTTLDEACRLLADGLASADPWDLLFADLPSAGPDGAALAARIGETCAGGKLPRVVLLTQLAETDPAGTFPGIDALLPKPFTQSRLFNTVVRLFGGDGLLTPDARAPFGDSAPLRGARVLLVEDDTLNQEVAVALLAQLGIEAVTAANGREALDMLDDAEFDAVLMDVHMPVMDGYAATHEIRKRPALHGMPVIAMTANAMLQDRERCLQAGMNDHIPKPIEPEQLARTLAHWLPCMAAARAEGVSPAADCELPQLPGVDVARGLWHTGGRLEHYLTLLGRFRSNHERFTEQLRDALAQGAPDDALRMVHTLKGLAGSLGAGALQEHAAALEAALKDDPHGAGALPLVAELDRLLAGLLDGIARMRASHAAPPSATPALQAGSPDAQAALAELMTQAAGLLEEFDSRIEDVVARMAPLVEPQWQADWQKLDHLVRGYDYEAALTRLSAWRHALNVRNGAGSC